MMSAATHRSSLNNGAPGTDRRDRSTGHGRPRILEAEGPVVLEHACRLDLEGIVSKRKGSRYQSRRSGHWVKAKNPNAPAMTRLGERIGWRVLVAKEYLPGANSNPEIIIGAIHDIYRMPQMRSQDCKERYGLYNGRRGRASI
jgi:hypothetical protein